MKKLLLFAIIPATFLIACNEQKPAETAKAAPKVFKPESAKLSENQLKDVMSYVDAYYSLKDALVATNEGKVKEAVTAVNEKFKALQISMMADTAHAAAFKGNLDSIGAKLVALSTISDASCEQQRAAFNTISDATFAMLKAVELKNAGIYRQFCPMAFNDKGAYWLSKDEEIKNPYFGKKMLNCGEIKDSL